MNMDDFNKACSAHSSIQYEAQKFIPEYVKYKGLDVDMVEYLDTMTEYDSETITFEGDEYWRYGGHEHHSLDLPTRFVFDAEYREELKKEYEDGIKKAEADKKRLEMNKKRAKAAKERRQYEKLKKKFESDG